MKMLEKVARAICESQTQEQRLWQAFIPEALAALRAIRNPDDGMMNAILLAAVDAVWAEGETVGEKVANQWRASIDSILAQKD